MEGRRGHIAMVMEKTENCLVSIIMGIYNCESTLSEAVDSLLNQTFQNWELILCDDGSSDGTYLAAQSYVQRYPEKIRLLQNFKNLGLNETLNRCLKEVKGEYVARMDGDDVCAPDRLEKELAVFAEHPELAVVSVGMYFYDEKGIFGSLLYPEWPQKEDLLYGSPFCHAGCMVRRKVYEELGGYRTEKEISRIEDYDLWFRLYQAGYIGYNIQEYLYSMRDDRNAVSRRKWKYRVYESKLKMRIWRAFHLPLRKLPQVWIPLIKGLMPKFVYSYFHRKRLNGAKEEKS